MITPIRYGLPLPSLHFLMHRDVSRPTGNATRIPNTMEYVASLVGTNRLFMKSRRIPAESKINPLFEVERVEEIEMDSDFPFCQSPPVDPYLDFLHASYSLFQIIAINVFCYVSYATLTRIEWNSVEIYSGPLQIMGQGRLATGSWIFNE